MEKFQDQIDKMSPRDRIDYYADQGNPFMVSFNITRLPKDELSEGELRRIMFRAFMNSSKNWREWILGDELGIQIENFVPDKDTSKALEALYNLEGKTFEEQMSEWFPHDFGPNKLS